MIIILVPLGEAQKLPCIVLDYLLLIRRSKPSASREIVSAPGENSVEPLVDPLIGRWLIMAYEVWDSCTAFKTSVDSKWNFIDANTMSAFLLEGCEQQNIRGSSLFAERSTSEWGRRQLGRFNPGTLSIIPSHTLSKDVFNLLQQVIG